MNRHIEAAKEVQKKPKVVFVFLEILLVIVVAFALAILMQSILMDGVFLPLIDQFEIRWYLSIRSMLYHLTSFGFVILYIFLVVKFYEKRKIASLGFFGRQIMARGFFGFFIAFLMMGSIVLMMLLLDEAVIDTTHLLTSSIESIPYLLVILIGWLIQGSAEEIAFQGWLLPKIGKTFGVVAGMIVVAVLFAVAHGLNPNMGFIPSINLVMYGLFAALYVLYERGIIGIMMFHAFWNFLQGNVFGLAVSGSGQSSISFTRIVYLEDSVLNGGSFGAEGGFIATLVLGIGIIVLGYLHIKRSKQKVA